MKARTVKRSATRPWGLIGFLSSVVAFVALFTLGDGFVWLITFGVSWYALGRSDQTDALGIRSVEWVKN